MAASVCLVCQRPVPLGSADRRPPLDGWSGEPTHTERGGTMHGDDGDQRTETDACRPVISPARHIALGRDSHSCRAVCLLSTAPIAARSALKRR